MEEAEGILQPQESEKLNFNLHCIQSPLVNRLWALAVLSQATGQCLLLQGENLQGSASITLFCVTPVSVYTRVHSG